MKLPFKIAIAVVSFGVLIFAAILINFVIGMSSQSPRYETPLPFDEQTWKTAAQEPQSTTRYRMHKDLLIKHLLIGLTKEEILELLGPTESDNKFADATHVSYWLAPNFLDNEWLVLEFRNNLVVGYKITSD